MAAARRAVERKRQEGRDMETMRFAGKAAVVTGSGAGLDAPSPCASRPRVRS